MDNKKQKLQCPNCGSDQYIVNHAGGATTTFLLCKKCGKKGTPEAWKSMKETGDSFNIGAFNLGKLKNASCGIGNVNELASDKPDVENDPELGFKRRKSQEKRNNIERILDKRYDPEHVKGNSLGDTKKMAFNLKNIKANKIKTECNCLSKHAHVDHKDMCEDCKVESKKIANKPFNMMKIAREFRYTDEQLERKELNKNTVFPEGRQDIKSKDSKGKGSSDEKYLGVEENRRFDTVDRKDAHTPDPKAIIPGYERWYDREVDQYYDGWLDHHIENAGGKVVGSNTEKTMNLNDNERYHAPKYPVEASYEKLLESRHKFDDDYKRKIAFNLKRIKKAQAYDLNDLRDEEVNPKPLTNSVPEDHKYIGNQDERNLSTVYDETRYDLPKLFEIFKSDPRYEREFYRLGHWTKVPNEIWNELKSRHYKIFEDNRKKSNDIDFDNDFGITKDTDIPRTSGFNLSKIKTSKKKI